MSAATPVGWLIYTIPVSKRRATRCARRTSVEKTEPPRPKGEELATRTASSSSSTRKIEETGPKNSVLAVGEPTGMPVMRVGWKKAPCAGTGAPTSSTATPASRAARTFPASSSTAD